jgi:predicted AAA+ superfamily ATPase
MRQNNIGAVLCEQKRGTYYDLQNPRHRAQLENAMSVVSQPHPLTVLDEIQSQPELTMVLRVLADRTPIRTGFLILGSASPELAMTS